MRPQEPSGCCISANVRAGRCVNGRDATCSTIWPGSLATSVMARYLMGAAACSMIQVRGNAIDGDGSAATGVSGDVEVLGLDGSEGGKVTEALVSGLEFRMSSSFVKTSC